MYMMIIDFETMGFSSHRCAAIDMAALTFDTERFISDEPYTLDDINNVRHWKLDVAEQVRDFGFEVDKSTLDFWQKQKPEVRANIKPKSTDLSAAQFAQSLHEYLVEQPKISRWWSRGNSFDPVILVRLLEQTGKLAHIEEYLKFWQVRDIRTLIDVKFDFNPPSQNGFCPISDEALWDRNFKQHDCRWDVLADVLRMQAIYRAENDLEMI
jgi:hypothetical protein